MTLYLGIDPGMHGGPDLPIKSITADGGLADAAYLALHAMREHAGVA